MGTLTIRLDDELEKDLVQIAKSQQTKHHGQHRSRTDDFAQQDRLEKNTLTS